MADAPDIERADRHSLLFEQNPVPMVIVSADASRMLLANDAAARLHARTTEELLATPVLDLLPASEEHRVHLATAMQGEGPIHAGEYQVVRSDGAIVVVDATFARSRFAGENVLIVSFVDVTARIEATRALRESEELLRVGFDEAVTPTALIDGQARYVRVNRAYCRLFRMAEADLLRTTGLELTHPDDRGRDSGLLADLREGRRRAVEVEKRYVRPDGSVIWAKSSGIVIAADDGQATLVMTEIIDQTALHETLEVLNTSQARLEIALQASSDGLYDADFATGAIVMNERAERILGYEGAEIPRTIADWAALVHPVDMESTWKALAEHARGERPKFEVELRMRRRDGTWAWILDRAKIVEAFPDGSPRRLIGTLTDISARRAAAEEIRRQKDVFDTVLSNIPILIAFMRPDGSFEYANRHFERTLGWTLAELRERDIVADLYPDPTYRARAMTFMASGSTDWHDWRLRTRDGRELVTTWTNVTLGDGRVIGIGQDVTEQRAAEHERRQLEGQLLQAQKLESLGVLAGGVAHDFNNLLVGILGNATLAEEVLPESSPATPLVGEMRSAASRAAELTRQLLAYAGKGRFVIERVDVSRLANEMTALLRAVVSKRATLHCDCAEELPPVEGDATQLRQIVMNLITNASEALEERPGVVTLRTGVMTIDDAYLRGVVGESELRAGQAVFVEVTDSGRGMDADTCARIFDPFFTTKFTGRGLGLAATLGIVRSHRGAVSVMSAVGEGTTIRIVLPVAPEASAPEAARARAAAPARWTSHGDVLLADDEPSVRTVSQRSLERMGFAVTVASDGREALGIMTADPARWRLVVLDLTMPALRGDEALTAMRAVRADLPAVLYSGYSEEALDARLTAQAGTRFLQKPFTVVQLAAAVREALGEGSDLS